MNPEQIRQTLESIFRKKEKRIVFWYDDEQAFAEVLPDIVLDGVTFLRLDQHPALEVKMRLELEDRRGRYVLYAPWPEPAPEADWLLDMRLYSYTFRADPASILLKELGLDRQSLRPYLKERRAFCRNQARVNRLKKMLAANDHADDIDVKMLAVVTCAGQPAAFDILMSLLAGFCRQGRYDQNSKNKAWQEIEKFGLAPAFWKILAETFGYVNADSPGLTDFLLRVFVTDLASGLKTELPPSLSHFVIQDSSRSINCTVFLSQWRSNTRYFKHYNLISKTMGAKLKIEAVLMGLDFETLRDVMTFEAAERRIISAIRNRIGSDFKDPGRTLGKTIKRRLDGYWATTNLDPDSKDNLYAIVYNAMAAAISLFDLRRQHADGLHYASAEKMLAAYTGELFRFDQHYRRFHELADQADMAGWDVLKTLRTAVEACYSGWFMEQLAVAWDDLLEHAPADGLLHRWQLPFVPNQYTFFDHIIGPILGQSTRKRVFVIISDALRFEAAEELTQKINGKYRLKAELEPLLGVLPGYTALGMAALLPHQRLSFKDSPAAEVLIDGKACASLEQRAAILQNHGGTAIKADALLSMKKDRGREFVKPRRLIYVYHNRIDATGDKAASEGNTFDAVRKTIEELYALVRFIINSLNGTRVFITADHGFIYQEKAPAPMDKSTLFIDTANTVKTHKRFILGRNLGRHTHALRGTVRATCHADSDLEFLLPRATNRYNFIGGARFFHGGAMLQEVVIPVIKITEMKGKHLSGSQVRRVGVSLLGSYKKLVTNRPIYKLIQTDAVSERMKPRTLKISLRDGNDLISNEETVTFNSRSSSMEERQKSVGLTLQAGAYDNKKAYYLVLRNMDDTEYERYPITIDIAFANDF